VVDFRDADFGDACKAGIARVEEEIEEMSWVYGVCMWVGCVVGGGVWVYGVGGCRV
jgi:hypothetical protein